MTSYYQELARKIKPMNLKWEVVERADLNAQVEKSSAFVLPKSHKEETTKWASTLIYIGTLNGTAGVGGGFVGISRQSQSAQW